MTEEALRAADLGREQGIRIGVLMAERIKPYDMLAREVLTLLPEEKIPVLFAEEEIRAGGFGMMLTDAMRRNGSLEGHPYTILATDDSFVSQDKPEPILRTAGVDAEAMTAAIKGFLGR